MRWFFLAVTMFIFAGCGSGVEWFPESNGSSGAPNGVTFATKTITEAEALAGNFSQSDVQPVTGTNTAGWTVSVSDSTGSSSEYQIASGGFVSTPGTILPNQQLQIQHKCSTTIGGSVTTVVKIGTLTTTFTTQTVANP